MIDLLRKVLEHPRLDRIAFALALLLTLPSLSTRMVFDDYVLGLQSLSDHDIAGLRLGPFRDLFTFTTGKPAVNEALMSEGVLLPWWTDTRHLNSFLRPLSSLTHRIDFALYPHTPVLMHLHSFLWFVALLLVARSFFRSTNQGATSLPALSFALFALDDPHGATLSWISNRNAIIALTLAMAAVVAHQRHVRVGSVRSAWAGPTLFALGLLSGEAAMGALGYLLAHALLLEQGAMARRLLRLVPYALIVGLWRLTYRVYHLGSFGSDGYHDPLREPAAFVLSLVQNLPILLGAQLSLPYADLAFWGDRSTVLGLWLFSLVVVAVIAALAWPLLRRNSVARFYALGMMLAAIPVSASVPGQRLLLGASFGASGLIALLLEHWLRQPQAFRGSQLSLMVLGVLHLPFSAAALPVTSRLMTVVAETVDPLANDLSQSSTLANQTCVIVNAPFTVFASYLQTMRAYEGKPRPQHLYWLASGASPLSVVRDSATSLVVTPEHGFLESAQDRHYRRDTAALAIGTEVRLPNMTGAVLSITDDGRPKSVRFVFNVALEDPALLMLEFQSGHYRPWTLPAVGESRHFEQQDLFRTLAQHVLAGE